MTDEPTMPADEVAPETRKTGYPAVTSPSSYPAASGVDGAPLSRAPVAVIVKTHLKSGFNDDPHGHFDV